MTLLSENSNQDLCVHSTLWTFNFKEQRLVLEWRAKDLEFFCILGKNSIRPFYSVIRSTFY